MVPLLVLTQASPTCLSPSSVGVQTFPLSFQWVAHSFHTSLSRNGSQVPCNQSFAHSLQNNGGCPSEYSRVSSHNALLSRPIHSDGPVFTSLRTPRGSLFLRFGSMPPSLRGKSALSQGLAC